MILVGCVYLLIGLAGLLGNSLTLMLLSKFQFSVINRSTKYLLMNQSAVDGCTALLLFTSYSTWSNVLDWHLEFHDESWWSSFLCNFWMSDLLFWSLIAVSSLNLMDIALERLTGVFHPIAYKKLQGNRLVLIILLCLCPWLVGICGTIPLYADTSVIVNGTCFYYVDFESQHVAHTRAVISTCISFYGPALVMIISYLLIYLKSKKYCCFGGHQSVPTDESEAPTTAVQTRLYRHMSVPANVAPSLRLHATGRLFIALVACFILCMSMNWNLFAPGLLFRHPEYYLTWWYKLGLVLSFINTCINPIIYVFYVRHFRSRAVDILSCRG